MHPQGQTPFSRNYRWNLLRSRIMVLFRQPRATHGSTSNLRSSPNSQPEDPESGRDGFRRDVTRSSAEFAGRSSGEFSRKGSAEFKGKIEGQLSDRTPLYGGPPQWWGREDTAESLTDIERFVPSRSLRFRYFQSSSACFAANTNTNNSFWRWSYQIGSPQGASCSKIRTDGHWL